MEKTTRRNILKVAGTAGVAAGLGVLIKPESEALAAEDHRHGGKPLAGPLSNATVTFGSWQTDPPFDRFANSVFCVLQTLTIAFETTIN